MSTEYTPEELRDKIISNLKQPLYIIGDRVTLDSGITGTIIACMAAGFYSTYIRPDGDYTIWNEKDENWLDKNVYAIYLDEPQLYMTLEEFRHLNPQIKEECIVDEYEKTIKPAIIIMVAEIMISGGA